MPGEESLTEARLRQYDDGDPSKWPASWYGLPRSEFEAFVYSCVVDDNRTTLNPDQDYPMDAPPEGFR